ncbi:MAG: polymer-forming cytoskeletal protein, partial [Oscillospiraceae bacterium]|nr:polymer-forming cytoskeletal protein [Oscillospiraceae bacterium]
MSLLIIFLTSTLVLATSASNRSHKNYASSQTEYTARTAIDSVLNAIKVDNTFAGAVCNVSSTSGSLSVPVEFKSDNLRSMGKIDDVMVEYVGTKDYFNPDSNKWEQKDLLKLTASVTLGGQTSTTSAYLVKDPPKPDGGGGGGAGFVTTGGASLANHSNIFGGSYLNIPSLAEAQTYNYLDGSKNYLSNEDFSLGNGQVVEADFVVNGNLNLSQDAVFVVPYQKTGITVWGDFNVSQKLKVDIETENCSSPYNSFNQIPYFYIDGTLKSESGININNSVEMNLFCGNIEATGNEFLATADVYCMDKAENNISTNNSTLSSWTASVINKTNGQNGSYVAGNLFSKGNLNLGKSIINGNVRVEGDVTISGEATITGDLVVGGTLTKSGNLNVSGNIYAENAVGFEAGTELKENVIQIENIYHPSEQKIKAGYTKVDNAFYEYEYKDFEYVETRYGWQKIYKDLNGNLTDKPGAYFDINGKEYNDWELKNVYSDEGKRGYYVMLDEEGNHLRKSDVISSLKVENPHWLNHFNNDDLVITEDKFYIYDSTGKYIASNETWNYMETVPEYYTIADISGADTGIKTPDSYSYYLQISPTEYNLISLE